MENGPFIDGLPIKNSDFYSYVKLPEGNSRHGEKFHDFQDVPTPWIPGQPTAHFIRRYAKRSRQIGCQCSRADPRTSNHMSPGADHWDHWDWDDVVWAQQRRTARNANAMSSAWVYIKIIYIYNYIYNTIYIYKYILYIIQYIYI